MKKIIITGGPSAGKTKISKWLKEKYAKKMILLPEAATVLYGGGFPRYEDKFSHQLQQKAIFQVQKIMEAIEERVHGDRLILCDRGTLDGLAYWMGSSDSFFKAMDSLMEKELYSYDVCLFLQSPSEKDYSRFSLRIEDYETALDIENKLYQIWSHHKNFHYIPRSENLSTKCENVNSIFSKIIESQQRNS